MSPVLLTCVPLCVPQMELSEGRRVKLNNVQLGASGMYKCEVIGEGPEFLTSDKHARMMVVSKYGKRGKRRDGDWERR